MTGAVAATIAGGIGAGVGVVTPSPTLNWSNVAGSLIGSTQVLTVLAITQAISVSATNSGASSLIYTLNGSGKTYTGAFPVHAGDTLSWQLYGIGNGTVTVLNQSNAGAVLATFTYLVTGIYF